MINRNQSFGQWGREKFPYPTHYTPIRTLNQLITDLIIKYINKLY